METQNPYSTPESQLQPGAQQHLNGENSVEFSVAAFSSLLATRSWIKFIACTLIFIAITSLVVILSIQRNIFFLIIDGLMAWSCFFMIVIPAVVAVFMLLYTSKAKKYTRQQSDDTFEPLTRSHSKLYLIISAACITSVLAFIFLIFVLISRVQQDYGNIQDRSNSNETSQNTQHFNSP